MRALVLSLAVLMAMPAFGIQTNPRLNAVMKNIARDFGQVVEPTKKPAAEVKDDAILTAVVRTRTMHFLFQQCIDRSGAVSGAKIESKELTPGLLLELSISDATAALAKYKSLLGAAQDKVLRAEQLLNDEYVKPAAQRNFDLLKGTIGELERVIGEAHGIFKPKKP